MQFCSESICCDNLRSFDIVNCDSMIQPTSLAQILSLIREWTPTTISQAYVRQKAIDVILSYEKRGLEAMESLSKLVIQSTIRNSAESSFLWPHLSNDEMLYQQPPPQGYLADVYFGEGDNESPNLPPMVLNEFFTNVGLTGMDDFAHCLTLVIRDASNGEYVGACCFEFLRLSDREGSLPTYAVYIPVIGSTRLYSPDDHSDNQSVSNYMISYARWLSKRLNGGADQVGFMLAQSVGYVMTGTVSNPRPRADPSSHGRSGRKFWERHSRRAGKAKIRNNRIGCLFDTK